jgi:hypothetical protein
MIYNLHTHNKNYAEVMRAVRDQLLAQSDWAMAPDAPTDKTAWAAYRQALRDYPATWEVAETANFPEAPA